MYFNNILKFWTPWQYTPYYGPWDVNIISICVHTPKNRVMCNDIVKIHDIHSRNIFIQPCWCYNNHDATWHQTILLLICESARLPEAIFD